MVPFPGMLQESVHGDLTFYIQSRDFLISHISCSQLWCQQLLLGFQVRVLSSGRSFSGFLNGCLFVLRAVFYQGTRMHWKAQTYMLGFRLHCQLQLLMSVSCREGCTIYPLTYSSMRILEWPILIQLKRMLSQFLVFEQQAI